MTTLFKTPGELLRSGPFLYVDGVKVGAIKNTSLKTFDCGQNFDNRPLLIPGGISVTVLSEQDGTMPLEGTRNHFEIRFGDEMRAFDALVERVISDERTTDVRIDLVLSSEVTVAS